jgi:four helix bundle protein
MGVRRFEDLIAWQLAFQLQEEVFAFTTREPATRDPKYCSQIQESSRSAARNTAEGFGRYRPKEFQYFLRIAAASLHETKNHLLDGLKRGYHSERDHERRRRLCLRGIKANSHLQRYLETAVAPGWDSKEPKNLENPENPENLENLENPENH